MPNLAAVRSRTWSLFLEPSPPQRAAFAARRAARAAAAPRPGDEPIAQFSVFDARHLERAMAVVAEMMRRANQARDDRGLEAALDHYQERRGEENPDLVDYALMVFITHHPTGRALTHSIPAMTLRNPELVAPSRALAEPAHARALRAALGAAPAVRAAVPSAFAGGVLPASDGLEWYREDPFANEHHTHWHVVYPTRGVPNPAEPSRPVFKPRQGELFFYMHQQMLARYDAERLAAGQARVAPRADYAAAIELGYNPGAYLQGEGYKERPPGAAMQSINGYTPADHALRRDRVNAAVAAGRFTHNGASVPIREVTLLGATVEANGAGVEGLARDGFYGNLHNLGHGMMAAASTGGPGVMTSTSTAIRDPVFYEWHKHIDEFYAAWQQKAGPQSFGDRPLVRLRKQYDPAARRAYSPDVILAFEDQLPPEAGADLQRWAAGAFGGAHWDDDFASTALTTDRLETHMLQRRLVLADRVTTVPMEQLAHRPFVYVFRVENQVDRAVRVTLRVFLVPNALAGDRRAWIEMDKFVHALGPLEKSVVARRGAQSSVVRKPAAMRLELLKPAALDLSQAVFDAMRGDGLPAAIEGALQPLVGRIVTIEQAFQALGQARWQEAVPFLVRRALLQSEQPTPPGQDDTPADIERLEAANYCTCGWPYNLLLPRGTPQGLPCRLAVIASDGEIDRMGGEESCGSLSFCGARDSYPDAREMGYPFNRPFELPIADTIMANANMAFRDVTVRRTPDEVDNG